ncbi:hypothetical protein ACLBX9_27180 [Methylobacterium sp. A49B]
MAGIPLVTVLWRARVVGRHPTRRIRPGATRGSQPAVLRATPDAVGMNPTVAKPGRSEESRFRL